MSMPLQIRTVKYRSKENQKYNPKYNRASISIPNDNLATDMTQSYISLSLRITSKNGSELTTDDLMTLKDLNMSISFGYGEHSYSPACLFKSVVLKKGSDGSIIESLPFSNFITQALYQLTTNKEIQSSTNLLNGTASYWGKGSSIDSKLSSLLKNPVQVQVSLSDLFGSCKNNTNFWMSETGGLTIEVLFEDKLDLLKVEQIKDNIESGTNDVEPIVFGNTFKKTLEFNNTKSYKSDLFPTVDNLDLEYTTNEISNPKGGVAFGLDTFKEASLVPLESDVSAPANQCLYFKDEGLTLLEINQLGIDVSQTVKLNFDIKSGSGAPKVFEMHNIVMEIKPYASATPEIPAVLQYNYIGGYVPPVAVPNVLPTEWTLTPPSSQELIDYYLPPNEDGINALIPTDILCNVSINAEDGLYTIQPTWNPATTYYTGQIFIIPAHYLGGLPSFGTGTPNSQDCVVEIESLSLTEPYIPITWAVSGFADPIPEPTPAQEEVKAHLVMTDAWYSAQSTNDIKFKRVDVLYQQDQLTRPTIYSTNLSEIFLDNLEENRMLVNGTFYEALQNAGLISIDGLPQPIAFELGLQISYPQSYPTGEGKPSMIQMINDDDINIIAPELVEGDTMSSNGLVRFPNTGKGCRLSRVITGGGGNYILEFTDLNWSRTVGDTFHGIYRTGSGKWAQKSDMAPTVDIIVFNVLQPRFLPTGHEDLTDKLKAGLTYDIDLMEVVLQQETKNKKMPMAKAFTTYKVEPFTIENYQYAYERQFNVLENSVFNIALIMPYSSSTLIPSNRNVHSYRWQINNISNTSNQVNLRSLTSDYASSLHLDKMLDYFNNSTSRIRNFYGILGLESQAQPVCMLPLKVYAVGDSNSFYTNPRGFTAQIELNASQESGKPIDTGNCYLVKSLIMSI
jgi:hypothetical protein